MPTIQYTATAMLRQPMLASDELNSFYKLFCLYTMVRDRCNPFVINRLATWCSALVPPRQAKCRYAKERC